MFRKITMQNNTGLQNSLLLLNEREVAALLKISIPTVRRWRMLGKPPSFRKLSGAVRYDAKDVADFLESVKRN